MKTVFILIGPKGSGKTYIGTLLERELGVQFLSVEPFFIRTAGPVIDEERFAKTWKDIRCRIDEILQQKEEVAIESTGTYQAFRNFLKELMVEYRVTLINISAPQKLCLQRIRQRDQSAHVPLSEEMIARINALAEKEHYDAALTIVNAGASDATIIEALRTVTRKARKQKDEIRQALPARSLRRPKTI